MCNVASCWIYIGILLGADHILHISRIRVKETCGIRRKKQQSKAEIGIYFVGVLFIRYSKGATEFENKARNK
jgi:hypothetical protein